MIRRALLTLGFVVSMAVPGRAQVLGLPVVNNGAPTGLSLGADIGFPNATYGSGTAEGARASVGLGFFGVSGMISHYSPKDADAVWSEGVSATLRLLGGPLVPFRITLQGGFGTWTSTFVTPGGPGSYRTTHVPISLGLSGTIPNPAFAIKPWIAPRIDVMHGDNGVGGDTRFGISGGVDLALLNGMAIRAAYDRRSQEGNNPSVFSLGLGFAP